MTDRQDTQEFVEYDVVPEVDREVTQEFVEYDTAILPPNRGTWG